MCCPIQTRASRIQDSNACIEVYLHVRHLPWTWFLDLCTFVWKAVGYTVDGIGLLAVVFFQLNTPSYLTDSMTVHFKGERVE
jgi:hypothetical protein